MITDENGNIDFQEWKVPTSWEEITLGKYQEIERYYADKEGGFNTSEVLHILCDKTLDEVNALPLNFIEKIMLHLSFLQEQPVVEPKNSIEINGEEYIVNTEKQLTFGEYVAADTILRADNHNYAGILAVVCRKEGEVFDSKFEAEVFDDRIKMFEEQPVLNVLKIIAFFLQLWGVLEEISQVYSQALEEVNLLVKNIETSQKHGLFKRLYLNWQMRKLKKLLK